MESCSRLDHIQRYLETALAEAYQNQQEAKTVASWLLESRLALSSAQLIAYPDLTIDQTRRSKLQADLDALIQGWPPQYVIGEVGFLNHTLTVGPGVLIPRPETEELAHDLTQGPKPPGAVLDIGAGTGCLAISLAARFPDLSVYALEPSAPAEMYLRKNIQLNRGRVEALSGNILATDPIPEVAGASFGLIVSNPPYVKQYEATQMAKRITAFEPAEALFVPDMDPLLHYRAIVRFASTYLCNGGIIAFEVHADHAHEVATLLSEHEFAQITVKNDLQNTPRFVKAKKNLLTNQKT